ncbi:MAG: extracellular solute-binding protein [bacterium]
MKLNIWVMPNAGFSTRKILQTEIINFQKIHPEYQINLSINPWSKAWDAMMGFIKGRTVSPPPDIIQVGSTWSSTLTYLGVLRNITDSFTVQSRKAFIRHALMSGYYPGTDQIYSIPWFVDLRVLYYRKDLLEKINCLPDDLDTWEGFKAVCTEFKRLFQKDETCYPLRLSGQRAGILMHDIAPWIWGAGGDFLASDGKKSVFNQTDALYGIEWYFDLIKSGIIPLVNKDGILPPGSFFTGEYALQFSGMWPLKILTCSNDPEYRALVSKTYGVTLTPQGKAGRWGFCGGSNLGVTTFTKYPAEAIEFVRYLVSSESQGRHGQSIGMFPSLKSAFDEMAALKPEIGKVFREALNHGRLMPQVLTLGTLEQILGDTTKQILQLILAEKYSKSTLHAEIQRAAREADYILSLYEA